MDLGDTDVSVYDSNDIGLAPPLANSDEKLVLKPGINNKLVEPQRVLGNS